MESFWDVDAHVLKQPVWVRVRVRVRVRVWHVSSCSAGGLNRPNSDMIVGDTTSSASARFPTCSMFSD